MIVNGRLDQRARRVDLVVLAGDAVPCAPLTLGNGLALVAAVGPALLPRALAVLGTRYLGDLDDAAAVVAVALPRLAGTGRLATLLFGYGARMEVVGYRVSVEAGRGAEVERLRHGAVCEPDLPGLALRIQGVPDMCGAAEAQVEWLRARGVAAGGRLVHVAHTDRMLIRPMDRQLTSGVELAERLEAGVTA